MSRDGVETTSTATSTEGSTTAEVATQTNPIIIEVANIPPRPNDLFFYFTINEQQLFWVPPPLIPDLPDLSPDFGMGGYSDARMFVQVRWPAIASDVVAEVPQ